MSEKSINPPQKSLFPIIAGIVATLFLLFGGVFVLGKMFADVPFDQNQVIFYYGSTCPHCEDVEAWINENDAHSKIDFEEKEVYASAANAQEMRQAAKICGFTQGSGVPFLYAKGECFVGTPDVIGYFERLLKE